MYAANRYRSNEATTATAGTLLVMLYDGISKFIRQADLQMEEGAVKEARIAIGRALDIISYLQATLDESANEDIVNALDQMYLAWTLCLVRASTQVDASKLQTILDQVEDIRGAWAQAKAVTEGGG